MKARVIVTLKNGVLDPQGQAIEGSLSSLGFSGVSGVRQGKVFDLEVPGTDEDAARSQIKEMCEKLLANTVIENYAIEISH
ncbi:MAG: phosphoribosylformylglycinamidine synthase subunit PurS [Devosia marina]|uniref:Phosphoribosylformylglycinamidine synthase subunit PurS n=1 Tax=Devosia marina TaxID=2683198 RepID=A0A7X3FRH6_9HYPH|nr:phosphoribosylformylglycinamidine synthase subunit PurS [Devosia marina]MVS98550.1 phosphoribosylformylglycinamidine synthase subunit PurS [Devosia marina]